MEVASPMLPIFDGIAGGLGTEGRRSSPSVGSAVPLVGGREGCLGREMVSGAGVAGAVGVMENPSGRQVHGDSKSFQFPEDRALELSSRLSRFDGSGWISFSSQVDQLVEERVEVPIESRSHEIDPEVLGHLVHGEADDKSRSKVRVDGEVPMVVPSWVDEVKALKQGDVYVGRGNKQRGLLPSFWANRYKVSKFGRDRAVELHRSEVLEDPQFGERVHELSGKRLLCHCRATERCHAENLQELFRKLYPCAFDVTKSQRAPLSSELNLLAKAREERVDSGESGLEEEVVGAPSSWPGKGKPMVIGSGYMERKAVRRPRVVLTRALGSRRSEVSGITTLERGVLFVPLHCRICGFRGAPLRTRTESSREVSFQ